MPMQALVWAVSHSSAQVGSDVAISYPEKVTALPFPDAASTIILLATDGVIPVVVNEVVAEPVPTWLS